MANIEEFKVKITADTEKLLKDVHRIEKEKVTLSNLSMDTAFFEKFIKQIQKLADASDIDFKVNSQAIIEGTEKARELQQQLNDLNKNNIKINIKEPKIDKSYVDKYIKENKKEIEDAYNSMSSRLRNPFTTKKGGIDSKFKKAFAESSIYFERIKSAVGELRQQTSDKDWFKGMSNDSLIETYQKMVEIDKLREKLNGMPFTLKTNTLDGTKFFDLSNLNISELRTNIEGALSSAQSVVRGQLKSLTGDVNKELDNVVNQVEYFTTGFAKIDVSQIDTLSKKLEEIDRKIAEINEKKKELSEKQKVSLNDPNADVSEYDAYSKKIGELNGELTKLKQEKAEINALPDKYQKELQALDEITQKYEALYGILERINGESIVKTLNSNEAKMQKLLQEGGNRASFSPEFKQLKEQSAIFYSFAKQKDVDLSGLDESAEKRASGLTKSIQYSEKLRQGLLEEKKLHEDNVNALQQELGVEQQKANVEKQIVESKSAEKAVSDANNGVATGNVKVTPTVDPVEWKEKIETALNSTTIAVKTEPTINQESFAEKIKTLTESLSTEINVAPKSIDTSQESVKNEQGNLSTIEEKLSSIVSLVNSKTNAFKQEEQVVEGTVQREVSALEVLIGNLNFVREEIEKITSLVTAIPEVDFGKKLMFEGLAEKVKENVDFSNIFDGKIEGIAKELTPLKDIDLSNLNKLNILNSLDLDKVDSKLVALHTHLDGFAKEVNNLKLDDSSILKSINSLTSKGDELKNLASILKSSRKDIETAASATSSKDNGVKSQDNERIKEANELLSKQVSSLTRIGKLKAASITLESNGDLNQAKFKKEEIKEEESEYQLRAKILKNYIDVLDKQEASLKIQKAITSATKEESFAKAKAQDSLNKGYNKTLNKSQEIEANLEPRDVNGTSMTSYEIKDIEKIKQSYYTLGFSIEETENKIKDLTQAHKDMLDAKTSDERVNAEKIYRSELKKTNDELEGTKKQYVSVAKIEKERQSLANWRAHNSKAEKVYGSDLDDIFHTLETGAGKLTNVELANLQSRIRQIKTEAILTGNAGSSMFDLVKDRAKQLFAYLSSFVSFYRIIDIGRQGFEIIREFDTALTEMRKVSDYSLETLQEYQKETFAIGDAVGATAKTIQDSTADWMRLGESIEEAKKSAQASNVLMNVSEFEDIGEATESLVSMSQAYQDLEKTDIIDKINNIGNNYSIATDNLARGMQNAAAVLSTQGNDIDKTIALITAGNAIVQDISKSSTGVRTIALRLAGTEEAKGQLAELGEDVDDFVVQTKSKTQDLIKDYTAVASNGFKGVDVLDANGNLRDTYEILLDISKVYKQIQEDDKKAGTNRANALVEYIAGKNRSNIAASILQNPEMLENVYKDSQNSSGSAQKELDKYLESIDGKMVQLQNKWQELWFDTVDSGLVKFFVDLGSSILDVTKNVGLLQTAFAGLMTFMAKKNGLD